MAVVVIVVVVVLANVLDIKVDLSPLPDGVCSGLLDFIAVSSVLMVDKAYLYCANSCRRNAWLSYLLSTGLSMETRF